MPNWAESDITIKGDRKALDHIEEIKFDFNKIIPQPEGLRLDCDSDVCAMCKQPYLKELYKKNGTLRGPHDYYCEDCDVGDNIGGRLHSDNIDDSGLKDNEKKLATQWQKEYGTASWYDWNCSHWNTKWNVGDVEFDRVDANTLHVKFDTAWSPPEPIFEKLARDLKVAIDVHVGGEVDDEYNLEYGDPNYKDKVYCDSK